MKAVEELGDYLDAQTDFSIPLRHKRELYAIAERMDEAVDKECRESYQNGIDAGMLAVAGMKPGDPWLREHGLIRSPVAKDGEPVHIGDRMVVDCGGPLDGMTGEITALTFLTSDYSEHPVWVTLGSASHEFTPGQLRHQPLTPAERIREILNGLDYDLSVREQPEPILTVGERDALYAIADELEAESDA